MALCAPCQQWLTIDDEDDRGVCHAGATLIRTQVSIHGGWREDKKELIDCGMNQPASHTSTKTNLLRFFIDFFALVLSFKKRIIGNKQ